MPNTRQIKRRIRSVQNIGKVTKAMEMVAASRMRRAQERATAARPYDTKIRQVIADLSATIPPGPEGAVHPLLETRPVRRVQLLLISTDRGLCGGLNSNIFRLATSFILEQEVPISAVAVGRKGRDFLNRCAQTVHAEFTSLGDRPRMLDIAPIARVVMDDYAAGLADRVYIIYPQFVTTMTQRPAVRQLLPVESTQFPPGQNVEYIFEPDPTHVLAQLLPRFVEMEIYHAILETVASEQSARMVAMRSATDNASELFRDLTLEFNKARQEAITSELLDMIGTKIALE